MSDSIGLAIAHAVKEMGAIQEGWQLKDWTPIIVSLFSFVSAIFIVRIQSKREYSNALSISRRQANQVLHSEWEKAIGETITNINHSITLICSATRVKSDLKGNFTNDVERAEFRARNIAAMNVLSRDGARFEMLLDFVDNLEDDCYQDFLLLVRKVNAFINQMEKEMEGSEYKEKESSLIASDQTNLMNSVKEIVLNRRSKLLS